MANLQPCKICETEGIFTPADWLITAQSEVMGFEPGNTFWVCMGCLAGLGMAWAQSQQPEPEPVPEPVPEGPGVLEQLEQDEGKVAAAGRNGKARKSAGTQQDTQTDAVVEEAAPADVDG